MENENVIQGLVSRFAPSIVGLENVKLGILLSVLSLDDYGLNRNRISVLLEGEPGTAKSQLMRYVCDALSYPYLEHRTSDAGLTGGLKGAGALSMGRVVCIDEFEKLAKKDQNGTLEAMSRGKIAITLDSEFIEYDAPVRIIASCNSKEKMSPEQLDRFDFIFRLEWPDSDTLKEIGAHKLDTWGKSQDEEIGEFRDFILGALQFKPEMIVSQEMKQVMNDYVDSLDRRSPRAVDALIRTGLALARLLGKKLDAEVMKRASIMLDHFNGRTLFSDEYLVCRSVENYL